ncbi:MAG: SCO6745 family protein [Acidimicrobiales bacterium]
MDYSDAIAAMFQPSPEGAIASPTEDASPARRFRDAIEPIAMHAVWSRATNESLAGLGLNFLSGYVWGRAAALGEPEPGAVVSSFAVFEPAMIQGVYNEGREACDRETLLATRTESTVASLTEVFGRAKRNAGVSGDLEGVANALQSAVEAGDGTGRPLYSGLMSRPWPGSAIGRLWHASEIAREHRGDSHVAVCVERGLGPIEMNVLTELWVGMPLGSYTASRGWSPESIAEAADGLRGRGLLDGDQLSAEGQAFRQDIEAATDRLEQPIIDAFGGDFDAVVDQLAMWSEECIAAEAFPPDVFKRAAG